MLSRTPLFPKRNGQQPPPQLDPLPIPQDLDAQFEEMAKEKFVKPRPPRTVDVVRDELVSAIDQRDRAIKDFDDHITALKTELKTLITEETTKFQGALAALGEADTWLDALPTTQPTVVEQA